MLATNYKLDGSLTFTNLMLLTRKQTRNIGHCLVVVIRALRLQLPGYGRRRDYVGRDIYRCAVYDRRLEKFGYQKFLTSCAFSNMLLLKVEHFTETTDKRLHRTAMRVSP